MSAAPAAAQAAPPADGWVTDLADMLDPGEEEALEALMASYQAGSGHEIALLTVKSLEGTPIESFALEVAREWGLGREDLHDGALLVVAREERKLRIEVGRGLEGTLTDSVSGRIIRDVIAPELRAGNTYTALRGGIEAMHAAAGGDYGAIESKREDRGVRLIGLLPLLFLLILLFSRGSRRRRRRRGGGDVSDLLQSALLGALLGGMSGGRRHGSFGHRSSGSSGGSGGFGGFGGGGGFSGGGASGGW